MNEWIETNIKKKVYSGGVGASIYDAAPDDAEYIGSCM